MFEAVKRDDVGALVRFPAEDAAVLDVGRLSPLARDLENVVADVNANHPTCAPLRHFDSVGAFAATEIDNRLSSNRLEEPFTQESF